jgi:hypothetical protein
MYLYKILNNLKIGEKIDLSKTLFIMVLKFKIKIVYFYFFEDPFLLLYVLELVPCLSSGLIVATTLITEHRHWPFLSQNLLIWCSLVNFKETF